MKKVARKTRQRKERQAEALYVAALRRQVVQYECYGDPAKMSKERMEAIIKRGKRRHMQADAFSGQLLAMAAMEELHGRRI
jgi:hypothetical protein